MHLAAITAPTLVFGAEEDRIIPRAHSEAHAAAMDGAVPGCGRALPLGQPTTVARVVLDVLGATTAAAS